MKDELIAFVFHKEKKEEVQEESVKADDMGRKVRELGICEDQWTDQQLKNQEENPRSLEKSKGSLNRIDKTTLEQNKEKFRSVIAS